MNAYVKFALCVIVSLFHCICSNVTKPGEKLCCYRFSNADLKSFFYGTITNGKVAQIFAIWKMEYTDENLLLG